MTIKDLSAKLKVSEDMWALLWSSFYSVDGVLRAPEDAGTSWMQFLHHVIDSLKGFFKGDVLLSPQCHGAGPSSCASFSA